MTLRKFLNYGAPQAPLPQRAREIPPKADVLRVALKIGNKNNPRRQLNEITPWLDGGLTYGIAKGWADVLRTNSNGSLHPLGKLASHDVVSTPTPMASCTLSGSWPPTTLWVTLLDYSWVTCNVTRQLALRRLGKVFIFFYGPIEKHPWVYLLQWLPVPSGKAGKPWHREYTFTFYVNIKKERVQLSCSNSIVNLIELSSKEFFGINVFGISYSVILVIYTE